VKAVLFCAAVSCSVLLWGAGAALLVMDRMRRP
jgi:hypothetical protein